MVSQLVCGKTGEIAERFSKLLENEWEFERVKDALDDGAELNSGGCNWRFTLRLLEFPFLFLAIVEKPAEEECEMGRLVRPDGEANTLRLHAPYLDKLIRPVSEEGPI